MKLKLSFLLTLFVLAGCGGASVKNDQPANQNPSNSASNVNADSATNSNPTLIPYPNAQNLNPNADRSPDENVKVVPYKPKEGELPYGSRTAPDDSVVSSGSRGKEFFEARTFKNHPVLLKVEKILGGPSVKYKIYLKNGKVIDGAPEKFENMAAMAPATILEAIGMQPSVAPAPAANAPKKN